MIHPPTYLIFLFFFFCNWANKIIKSTNKRWLNKQVEKIKKKLYLYMDVKEINAYKQMVKILKENKYKTTLMTLFLKVEHWLAFKKFYDPKKSWKYDTMTHK